MITVYGIKSCDTVKKALKWLEERGIEHAFHDVRADGLDRPELERWAGALGWEAMLNRRSTTWRNLTDADKDGLNEARALDLMLARPTLIKRPLFDFNGLILQGFDARVKARLQ
ncbi:MAG: ArsC family reductase [Alphaproteobacteria bacterium]|nr:ArsC family reductase [Alphaproteobacteria bacterium]MBF0250655.1 ArsC family reductase [Alphaproteobacteria bacterium]